MMKLRMGMMGVCMVACFALWTSAAMADVVPPDVSACEGKSTGDACTTSDQTAGKCEASKCTRTLPPVDGGQPQTQEYDCTKCVAGSTTDPLPSENTGGNDGGTTQDSGTNNDAGTTPPKSGCDIAGGARFGMGFVLLFLGFLAAWRLTRTSPSQAQGEG